jgi:hypothetical protein
VSPAEYASGLASFRLSLFGVAVLCLAITLAVTTPPREPQ